MSRGIHRCTSDSKRGRQVAADTGRIEQGPGPTPEQRAHNERIEAARLLKKSQPRQRRKP